MAHSWFPRIRHTASVLASHHRAPHLLSLSQNLMVTGRRAFVANFQQAALHQMKSVLECRLLKLPSPVEKYQISPAFQNIERKVAQK